MVLLIAPVVPGDGEDDDEVRCVEAERMVAVSCSGSCWCDGGVSPETCGRRCALVEDDHVDWLQGKENGGVREVRTDKGEEMAQKREARAASTHRKQARNSGGRRSSGE